MQLIIESKELRNIFDKIGDCPDRIGLQIPDPMACAEGGKCGECWERALLEAGAIVELSKEAQGSKISARKVS